MRPREWHDRLGEVAVAVALAAIVACHRSALPPPAPDVVATDGAAAAAHRDLALPDRDLALPDRDLALPDRDLALPDLVPPRVCFAPPVLYPGTNANPAVPGDLDGDGNLDLILPHQGGTTLLRGRGNTTLATGATLSASGFAALTRLDGDAHLDLVLSRTRPDLVQVFHGNGDGTFRSGPTATAGSFPVFLAAADLDGDGRPDVAVANRDSNGVSVLAGRADGSLAPAVTYPVGESPIPIAVGDVDGDRDLDIVAGNTQGSDLSVLLGDGRGGFVSSPPVALPGTNPVTLAIADLDGDRRSDVVVGTRNGTAVIVVMADARGGFHPPTPWPTQGAPMGVAVGDFDGDGALDIADSAPGATRYQSVLIGRGDGSFLPGLLIWDGVDGRFVTAVDLDADGLPELAVAGPLGCHVFRNIRCRTP